MSYWTIPQGRFFYPDLMHKHIAQTYNLDPKSFDIVLIAFINHSMCFGFIPPTDFTDEQTQAFCDEVFHERD